MARYRTIDVRMWGDEKFRELSRPKPNAQTLWTYILTGEHTGPLPGLSRVGEQALAEQLGWSLKDFRRCWAEIAARGMATADWKARVLWVPKRIEYAEPENPNVVKGWRSSWDEIPECAVRSKAWKVYDAHMLRRDQEAAERAAATNKPAPAVTFSETFRASCPERRGDCPSNRPRNGCGNGSGNGSGNGMPNQEQEQEQEQDLNTPPPTPAPGGAGDGTASPCCGFCGAPTAPERLEADPLADAACPLCLRLKGSRAFASLEDARDAIHRALWDSNRKRYVAHRAIAFGGQPPPGPDTPAVTSETPPVLVELLDRLSVHVNQLNLRRWFTPLTLVMDDGNVVTLRAPSPEHQRYLERHYREQLQAAGASIRGGLTVRIIADDDSVTDEDLSEAIGRTRIVA